MLSCSSGLAPRPSLTERGDAEIVGAEREHGQAKEETDLRGERARDEHGQKEDDLLRDVPGQRAAGGQHGREDRVDGVADKDGEARRDDHPEQV